MTSTTITVVINTTKQFAEAVRKEIEAQPDSEVYITERKNLNGDIAMWLLVANLSVQVLPHILAFLKDYLASKQVKRIKVGDVEIENPTPADLQRFRAMIDSHSKPEEVDD